MQEISPHSDHVPWYAEEPLLQRLNGKPLLDRVPVFASEIRGGS